MAIEEFFPKLIANVSELQSEFDTYQKAFFPPRSPEFFCLELNGEAGELANFEKKVWKGKNIAHESLADEAADVLIALMNYSNSRQIDLAAAVSKKLRKIDRKRLDLKNRGLEY